MDYNALKEHIQSLIKDDMQPEEAEKIGGILHEVEQMEQEHKTLEESHEQLRGKYIQAIKQSSFNEAPKSAVSQNQLSFEDCVKNVINERG